MSRGIALITGATDGVGKATARQLLLEGWEVVVTGRSRAKCDATVDELRQSVSDAKVSALVADLSQMADVKALADAFVGAHERLDLLVLNANSISQEHKRTVDGFESNLAIGYFGRVLLTWRLESVLKKTPESQVLTVVGLNLERLDFADPSTANGFSAMKALGRWQWAMQVFVREWNRRKPNVAMNVYMPGLVKTKILANEPQPMRLFVQIAKFVVGVSVEASGKELAHVINEVKKNDQRDAYYARTKLQPARDLRETPQDGAQLWSLTERLLERWK